MQAVVKLVKRGPRKARTPTTAAEKPKRERKPREPRVPAGVRSKTPVNNLSRKVVHAVQTDKRQKLEDKDYKVLFGEAPIEKQE